MRCLVIGSNGFIGKSIYSYLKSFDFLVVDGLERKDGFSSRSYDIIFHCAGITPSKAKSNYEYIEHNLILTQKIIEHYKGVKMVFCSTKDIYGMPDINIINEETYPCNQSVYGATKYLAEKLIGESIAENIILRLPTVVGLNSPLTFIAKIVNNIISDKRIILYNANKHFNSVVHLDDIQRLFLAIVNNVIPPGVYNIASSNPIYLGQLPEIISYTLNMKVPIVEHINHQNIVNNVSINKIDNYIKMSDTKDVLIKYAEDIRKKVLY